MTAYIVGIGGVFRSHVHAVDVLFFLRWHAGYAVFLGAMMAIPAVHMERKTRRILAVLSPDYDSSPNGKKLSKILRSRRDARVTLSGRFEGSGGPYGPDVAPFRFSVSGIMSVEKSPKAGSSKQPKSFLDDGIDSFERIASASGAHVLLLGCSNRQTKGALCVNSNACSSLNYQKLSSSPHTWF